jgi:hypothetical protein
MYPAQGIVDEIFSWEDLPENLTAEILTDSGVLNFSYTKLSPPAEPLITINGLVYYVEDNSAELNSGDENVLYLNNDDNQWRIWIGATEPTNNNCLINDVVSDTFADIYSVELLSGEVGVYTVTRRSLCVWSETLDGEEPSGVLIIAGSLPNGTMIWEVRSGDGADAKSDNLNSPVGSYGIPTTRSIVSEL